MQQKSDRDFDGNLRSFDEIGACDEIFDEIYDHKKH